jgi:RNA recognition motif-containing protein
MYDKYTGIPRGFGFVIFNNNQSVEHVMKMKNSHCIRGKWIDCKPATPKEFMDQINSSNINIKKIFKNILLKNNIRNYSSIF